MRSSLGLRRREHPLTALEEPRWLVLTLKRHVSPGVQPSAAEVPPKADLVIENIRVSRSAAHTYHVNYMINGTRGRTTEVVPGVSLSATTLLAAARAMASTAPVTVALPATRGWPGLLLDGSNQSKRATHPVLYDAMKVLRRWEWKAVGGWLVGARTET